MGHSHLDLSALRAAPSRSCPLSVTLPRRVEERPPPFQVFQRRNTGQLDFFKRWRTYVEGFGDPMKEFWLGTTFETPGGEMVAGRFLLEKLTTFGKRPK